VLKHERYEEICAAASIGEASPEDLAVLETHASTCSNCRSMYESYLEIAARHYAGLDKSPSLSREEAEACLNSELLARRFFERAEREGIVFSSIVAEQSEQTRGVFLKRRIPWSLMSRAAAVILALSASGAVMHYGINHFQENRKAIPSPAPLATVTDGRIQEIDTENRILELRLRELNADLLRANTQLNGKDVELQNGTLERRKLESERDSLATDVEKLRQEFAESQNVAAGAQLQLARLKNHADGMEATLAAFQVRVGDLSEQLEEKSAALEKDRQLLAMGHDVTDLMAARNLHIVDVVDTDARGKTRPAFGRIFFTEGKSLVFYAYDLNETKIQKASYQYRVWAKKEGGTQQVQSLGIFYADDKLQKRWVFKCNDPKILSEIDSVFVTLEPTDADSEHPKGTNLMYAYLHGRPNHP
jgi:hypothetical protein